MASVYGLEASQKCITPSACAVVAELVTLAVSSGSFSLLVAFELPVSSKRGDGYLVLCALWGGKLASGTGAGFQMHLSSLTNLDENQEEGRDIKLLLCVRTRGWAEQGPQRVRVPAGCGF